MTHRKNASDRPEDMRGPPGNSTRHLVSLSLSKLADGLVDPKLVLAWIMSALGAPGYLIGALVPVREAGSLLPQLVLARWIQQQRVRARIWALGSAVQGGAAICIALAALSLSGAAAGWSLLGGLLVLAVARSACSASYKDILARTVPKGRRARISGTAASVSAAAVLVVAGLLGVGVLPRTVGTVALVVMAAGVCWLAAALVFRGLDEPAADTGAGSSLGALVRPLQDDPEFRRYVAARALLVSTALAPPFLVMLGGGPGAALANLGALMVASGLAALVSGWIWGRLSDRSSRRTLAAAAGLAALVLGVAAAAGWATEGQLPSLAAAGLLFAAQIAYQGARTGRKAHLTDMDTGDMKPAYTALSNGLIGVLLVAGGGLGLLADLAGPAAVLAVLAALSAAALPAALRLEEVQQA